MHTSLDVRERLSEDREKPFIKLVLTSTCHSRVSAWQQLHTVPSKSCLRAQSETPLHGTGATDSPSSVSPHIYIYIYIYRSLKITFRFHARYFVFTSTMVTVIYEENILTLSLFLFLHVRVIKKELLYNTTQHLYNSTFFCLDGIPLEIKKKRLHNFVMQKIVCSITTLCSVTVCTKRVTSNLLCFNR